MGLIRCALGMHDYRNISVHNQVGTGFVGVIDSNIYKCKVCGHAKQQMLDCGEPYDFDVDEEIIREEISEIDNLVTTIKNNREKALSDLGWTDTRLDKFLHDVETEKSILMGLWDYMASSSNWPNNSFTAINPQCLSASSTTTPIDFKTFMHSRTEAFESFS